MKNKYKESLIKWICLCVILLSLLLLVLSVELKATELDFESMKELGVPIQGNIPEKQICIDYYYPIPDKDYKICVGDRWKNTSGVILEVEKIKGHEFKWRKLHDRIAYTLSFRCGEDNKPDLCGKLLKRGKGKCITINCGDM